jgi:tRNA A37 threonylcarbamoyltransferase TsaD
VNYADVAASFQRSMVETLTNKAVRAAAAGGFKRWRSRRVSANRA